MNDIVGFVIRRLKNHADSYCKKQAPELWEDGYMEQELDNIYEDIESFVRGELCVWDETQERHNTNMLVSDAEHIAEVYYSEWEEEVETAVDNSISIVADYLAEQVEEQ